MIDTLTLARELTESGIKREKAEAIADVVAKAVTHQNGSLATTEFVRTQIGDVQKETGTQLESMRVEIGEVRVEISELRNDMETKIGEVRVEISELRNDMETKIGEVRVEIGEVRVEISELRSDMNAKIGEVRAEISATEVRIVRWLIGIGIALGLFQVFGDRILGI